METDRS